MSLMPTAREIEQSLKDECQRLREDVKFWKKVAKELADRLKEAEDKIQSTKTKEDWDLHIGPFAGGV